MNREQLRDYFRKVESLEGGAAPDVAMGLVATTPDCRWCWGSHGCFLPAGHFPASVHRCQDHDGICSEHDGKRARFNEAEDWDDPRWTDWIDCPGFQS